MVMAVDSLTDFSPQECCLRNWGDEKRMSSVLIRLVDIEDPPIGFRIP